MELSNKQIKSKLKQCFGPWVCLFAMFDCRCGLYAKSNAGCTNGTIWNPPQIVLNDNNYVFWPVSDLEWLWTTWCFLYKMSPLFRLILSEIIKYVRHLHIKYNAKNDKKNICFWPISDFGRHSYFIINVHVSSSSRITYPNKFVTLTNTVTVLDNRTSD